MKILISGAGFAGLSLARTLSDLGADVTVVERAPAARAGGAPIDIRGDALGVIEDWGILPAVRDRQLHSTEFARFVDAGGRELAALPLAAASDSDDDIEIDREDLIHIIDRGVPAGVGFRFGDSAERLDDHDEAVSVEFASGARDDFDLVVGADGLHSRIRRLVFGPESAYTRFLGVYIAYFRLEPDATGPGKTMTAYNFPGHAAATMQYRDSAIGAFIFRSPWLDYDYRDVDAHRRIIAAEFAGTRAWRIPDLLHAMQRDDDLYFDSASQIHMPSWYRGRVVLVGDAAYSSAFLSGRGTSLAILGASRLTDALAGSGGDHAAAFRRYTEAMRPYVDHAQQSVEEGGDLLVPATQEAIEARNASLRAASSA
jgi:2-polyprenyl-6-methoxyphenol hydroxylase-like FAD-dependent oxidoreductase